MKKVLPLPDKHKKLKIKASALFLSGPIHISSIVVVVTTWNISTVRRNTLLN
jgi:hypothetical protein